jgi:preprotein translocase subunit SecF
LAKEGQYGADFPITNIDAEKIDKTITKRLTPSWLLAIFITLGMGILLFIFAIFKKYRIL